MSDRDWTGEPTKAVPVEADQALILDSADSNNNKLVTFGSFGGAVWDRTAGKITPRNVGDIVEFAAMNFASNTIIPTTLNADLFLEANGTGQINVTNFKIQLLGTPTIGTDAANKNYVDANDFLVRNTTTLSPKTATDNFAIGLTTTTLPFDVERNTVNLALFRNTGSGAARVQIRANSDAGIEFLEGAIPQWVAVTFNNNFEVTSSGVSDGILLRKSDGAMGVNVPNVAALHNMLDILSTTASTFVGITSTFATGDVGIKFELTDNTPLFTMGIDNSDADKFKIGTTALDASTRVTIDSTGKVGIGVTDPTELLEVNETIKIREFNAGILDLGAMDNLDAGGRIIFRGGGNGGSPHDDWFQDVFFDLMRIFTNSSTPETLQVFNAGSSTIDIKLDGSLLIAPPLITDPPLHRLDNRGSVGHKSKISATDITSDFNSRVLVLTNTSVVRTVTLATADNVVDRMYTISDRGGQAGTNNITITPVSPALINGVASLTNAVAADYGAVDVQSDGTNWFTVGG